MIGDKKEIINKLKIYAQKSNLDGLIAENLLANASNPANMTIKKIAFLSSCSTSAIFRFIKLKLKINSFYNLKYALKSDENNYNLSSEDQYIQAMIGAFKNINHVLNHQCLKNIINKLYQWNNIYIIAKGNTFSIVEDFVQKLKNIGLRAHSIRFELELEMKSQLIEASDGVIFISTSAKNHQMITFANKLALANISYLLFTSNSNSQWVKENLDKTILINHQEFLVTDLLLNVKNYYIYAIDKIILEIILNDKNKRAKVSKHSKI